MTDRVTDAELRGIETAIEKQFRGKPLLSWWEKADGESPPSVAVSSVVAKRLVTELRRLRALFAGIADPIPTIGPQCPHHGDRCWWCAVKIHEQSPEPHAENCPWPELEREVLAAIED